MKLFPILASVVVGSILLCSSAQASEAFALVENGRFWHSTNLGRLNLENNNFSLIGDTGIRLLDIAVQD